MLYLPGMTLPKKTAYVQHMYKEEMILHPVALGDMDPPIQVGISTTRAYYQFKSWDIDFLFRDSIP
jgi:hypothetical protein